MKRVLWFLSVSMLMNCGNTSQDNVEDTKEVEVIAILKDAPFIHLQLKVLPYSPDSIIAKAIITNKWDKDLAIYKPLLPSESYNELLYSVSEKTTYKNVVFNGHKKESYLSYSDGPSNYIDPKLDTGNFVILQPNQSLEVESNIAQKFQFKEFLEKGFHEFKLTYYKFWPYVVNGKKVTEIDTTDHQMKPVYFLASMPLKDDPDSMKVEFKIP